MIGVLAEPIIIHFSLTDTQFGLLSGVAFALFYTSLGIPIARLSEHANRVWIIGGAIILWSAMTILCGLATSFWMLFAFRLGVGVGEAGLTPPANSLLSDYFKPASRTRALAIYATGITVGMCLANLFVGLTGSQVSWQQTFIIIGAAGIPVGLVILCTIKEVPRGYSDPVGYVAPKAAGLKSTLTEVGRKWTFWGVTLGSTLASFVSYGMGNFVVSFLVRNHGISVPEAALLYMAPLALAGAVGTSLCGILVGKIAGGRPEAGLWFSSASLIVSSLAFVAAFNSGVVAYIFPLLLLANFFQYWFLGPMYAALGAVASARARATAVAVMLFVVNLIGYGLGPLFVGWVSDQVASAHLKAIPDLSLAICRGTSTGLDSTQLDICAAASAGGLRISITITVLLFIGAAFLFASAARSFSKDAEVTVS